MEKETLPSALFIIILGNIRMRDDFDFALWNDYAMIALLIGLLGAISTSRWFVCRLCGLSNEALYRCAAIWPAIMLSTYYFLLTANLKSSKLIFAIGITLAFGVAFSIDNLRIPSRYSRAIGTCFGLLHLLLLNAVFREAWSRYDWSRTAPI